MLAASDPIAERQLDAQRRAGTGRAGQGHRPSDRLDAVFQAEQSRALGRIRATASVVANLHKKGAAVGGHRYVLRTTPQATAPTVGQP